MHYISDTLLGIMYVQIIKIHFVNWRSLYDKGVEGNGGGYVVPFCIREMGKQNFYWEFITFPGRRWMPLYIVI